MTMRPSDVTDLYLAPVALRLDATLAGLSEMSGSDLHKYIGLRTNQEPSSQAERADLLMLAITHMQDLHEWVLSWDERGLRLAHDEHCIVLGVPNNVREYIGR